MPAAAGHLSLRLSEIVTGSPSDCRPPGVVTGWYFQHPMAAGLKSGAMNSATGTADSSYRATCVNMADM